MIRRAALALVCLAAAACRKPAEVARSDYVDPAQCATCHRDIAETYKLTGMGRSFYKPHAGDAAQYPELYNKASDRYYTIVARGGELFERRHQKGFDGAETNVLEARIDYVVGSGNHARTYLHRNLQGKLIELPVSWYSEKGGYLAMSPGYDRRDQQDFRRAVNYDCMFCHNGYPLAAVPDPGSDEPIYGPQVPEGIDCQRCHGPGRAHVEAASNGGKTEAIRAAIVNPAKLGRDRQLEVCMQCHLETTSLRLPNAIRRYDREPFSYRPGQPLGDYEVFFDRAPNSGYDDRFEVAHAAYRLAKSACFLKSQMTCLTCHDPHKRETADHYVAVCKTCHAQAHNANQDCLGCHMWKRRAEDAVHLSMTDHFIQRRKPARDFLAPREESEPKPYRGEVVAYYPKDIDEVYLAVAQTAHQSNLDPGLARLQSAVNKTKPIRPEFYDELGQALAKANRNDEAIAAFERGLQNKPDFRPALNHLSATLTAVGQLSRAAEIGEKAAAIQPPDAVALANLGNVYLQQGNYDLAQQTLTKALAVDPEYPDAHNLLGMVWLRRQDRAAAENAFREAIRFQPDHAEAHNNLAGLLADGKDYPQAEFHFRKAIEAKPGYAEAHHSYGFLLTLMRRLDQAMVEFDIASRIDPKNAQTHVDLADLLAAKGRTPDAERHLRSALDLAPDHFEAHLALAQILARTGRKTEAIEHFQRAAQSPDPEIREAASAALP